MTSRPQVLVIEDEPVIAGLCRRTLAAAGFDVDIAVNGLIAMTMVDRKTYDVLLNDIRTPGMNGIQFFRYLTERHPEQARRVIFTTGDVMNRETSEFLRNLTTPWLPKPFAPADLMAIVAKVASGTDTRQAHPDDQPVPG